MSSVGWAQTPVGQLGGHWLLTQQCPGNGGGPPAGVRHEGAGSSVGQCNHVLGEVRQEGGVGAVGGGWAAAGRPRALSGASPRLPSWWPVCPSRPSFQARYHLLTRPPPNLGRQECWTTKLGHANSHLNSTPGQHPRGGPLSLQPHSPGWRDSPISRCPEAGPTRT